MSRLLQIASFLNVLDNEPKQETPRTWEELCFRLSHHRERASKEDVGLWSPVEYLPKTPRGKEGVIKVHAFVIDFDHGETKHDPAPLPAHFAGLWAGREVYLHTTHRHTDDKPRWRAIFPLTSPVPAHAWPLTWAKLMYHLADGLGDPAVKDCSRLFYLPSHPKDAPYFATRIEGDWLDPDAYPDPPPLPKPIRATMARLPVHNQPEDIRERLLDRALQIAGSDSRHGGCIWLMRQCHDNRLDRSEATALGEQFVALCGGMNSEGKEEEFPVTEMEGCLAWGYAQPQREPWKPRTWEAPVPMPTPPPEPKHETPAEVLHRDCGTCEPEPPPEETRELVIVPAPGATKRTWRTSTFEDLAAMDLEEPQFPVEGLIREGINLCQGKTGDGKTWLSTDIAIAIAAGGKALGHRDVIQGDVLYIAFEESRGEMFQRLLQIREETQSFPCLEIASASDGDWPMGSISETLTAIREWLTEHPAARLVVIDPLLGYLAAVPSQNGNMVQGDYNIIKQMRTLARQFPGVAFLVHDHRSKAQVGGPNGRDPMDSGVHSSGTIAAADNRLSLVREDGNVFKLHVKGRMVTNQELRLHFDPGLGAWEVKEDGRSLRKSEVGMAILHALAFQPEGMHSKQIAERINATIGTVKGRLFRLARTGHVVSIGGGEYRLP